MADSPVRWGILGTGGIASTFVTDLRLTDSGVAVAVGSRSQGSANRFADEFGIAAWHASYESLVADPRRRHHVATRTQCTTTTRSSPCGGKPVLV